VESGWLTVHARKNYAGTSPVTRQSGKKKLVLARHVHNDRLVDTLGLQALSALRASPGARRGVTRSGGPYRVPLQRHGCDQGRYAVAGCLSWWFARWRL